MRKETEIHKNMVSGETEIKTLYIINVERDSVCLGDDITAPHRREITFEKNEKLSDLFNKLMNSYLNNLHDDCKWKITLNNKVVLGYIKYSAEGDAKYELLVQDDYIINLDIKLLYCSNKCE